jgi:hypothetical protein
MLGISNLPLCPTIADPFHLSDMQLHYPLIDRLFNVSHGILLTPVLLALALSASGQNFTTVGNAGSQSLAGAGPNPYASIDNTTRGTRQQYIIRGQELLDAGIPANAQIVSVGFNITQAATTEPVMKIRTHAA